MTAHFHTCENLAPESSFPESRDSAMEKDGRSGACNTIPALAVNAEQEREA